MQDNRNKTNPRTGFNSNCGAGNGTVCIDTMRVLDCCRDRDCFEDTRVFLTPCGEEILANSGNVRARSAKILCANVVVEEVPFNCGFFRVVVRYYIELEFEACVCVSKSQNFKGIAVLEKDVVLYGGEGGAFSFRSGNDSSFCRPCDLSNRSTNEPVGVVETVEPIVLGTKVLDCTCACPCPCGEYADIPESVRCALGEDIVLNGSDSPRIYVSLGVFSVIRLERPAQLLVQATDYSVPDKECTPAGNGDSPCDLFRTIAFPVAQFRATECCQNGDALTGNGDGGCGCGCGRNN